MILEGGYKYSLVLSSLLVELPFQFCSRQAVWSPLELLPDVEIITLFQRAEAQITTDFYTNPAEVGVCKVKQA